MHRLNRVQKKGWGAGTVQGRGYLLANNAGFADSGYNQPARAGQNCVYRLHKFLTNSLSYCRQPLFFNS
jgi:hypothetical protein